MFQNLEHTANEYERELKDYENAVRARLVTHADEDDEGQGEEREEENNDTQAATTTAITSASASSSVPSSSSSAPTATSAANSQGAHPELHAFFERALQLHQEYEQEHGPSEEETVQEVPTEETAAVANM